jgi:CheY-like chemotaxis protein
MSTIQIAEAAQFETLQSSLRVLVVDDEPRLGRLIARQLQKHRVTVERRARDAVTRIESGEIFDRIICDMVMPGMGGREFFEHIERAHPHLLSRLAFISGGVLSDTDLQWLARVTLPVLRKPFSQQELAALLETLPS